jgi:hypothetical protein
MDPVAGKRLSVISVEDKYVDRAEGRQTFFILSWQWFGQL